MKLLFFNSKTRTVEDFQHDPDQPIHIYTCGPTVYDRAHLGNLRTFLWSDFIVGVFRALGYSTKHIMNITDVDDKIITRLPEKTLPELVRFTSYYTTLFLQDMTDLGITHYTEKNIYKVTDHLPSIENMIHCLREKGFAYETSDGSIYFDMTGCPLTPFHPQKSDSELVSGRAIIRADNLRTPRDFVLWKNTGDLDLGSFQQGRPGWHIECSAIADAVLDKVHIHMGGSDLRFPHHAAEISQSESYKPDQVFGDAWIHMGFLHFEGEKMSKSIGNVLRLDQIPDNKKLLRFYLLSKPYRNSFDFCRKELQSLEKDFVNLHLLYQKLDKKLYKQSPQAIPKHYTIHQEILAVLTQDFNAPVALRLLFSFVDQERRSPLHDEVAQLLRQELDKINTIFNILDHHLLDVEKYDLELARSREALRKEKKYQESDEIRGQLEKKYIFEDDPFGFSMIQTLKK